MFGGIFMVALAACPSSEALTAQARTATAGDVDVDVSVTDDVVHVVVVARGETTVERTLDVTTADCHTLPDLVVVVARRALSALPQAAPVQTAPVLPSLSSSSSPSSSSPSSSSSSSVSSVPSVEHTPQVLARVAVGVGLGLPAGGDGRFGVGVRVPVGVFVVDVGAEVDGGLPQHIAAGHVWSGAVVGAGRLGVRADLGRVRVLPFVSAGAGGLVVAGHGNVEDAAATALFVRLGGGVAVDVGAVEVGLGVELGPDVELRAGTATTSLPGTKLVTTAAWTFSLE